MKMNNNEYFEAEYQEISDIHEKNEMLGLEMLKKEHENLILTLKNNNDVKTTLTTPLKPIKKSWFTKFKEKLMNLKKRFDDFLIYNNEIDTIENYVKDSNRY